VRARVRVKSEREKKTDWKRVRDNSCKGNKCVLNVRKIEIGRENEKKC
jgi:hypothetical protein